MTPQTPIDSPPHSSPHEAGSEQRALYQALGMITSSCLFAAAAILLTGAWALPLVSPAAALQPRDAQTVDGADPERVGGLGVPPGIAAATNNSTSSLPTITSDTLTAQLASSSLQAASLC